MYTSSVYEVSFAVFCLSIIAFSGITGGVSSHIRLYATSVVVASAMFSPSKRSFMLALLPFTAAGNAAARASAVISHFQPVISFLSEIVSYAA